MHVWLAGVSKSPGDKIHYAVSYAVTLLCMGSNPQYRRLSGISERGPGRRYPATPMSSGMRHMPPLVQHAPCEAVKEKTLKQ